LGLTSGSTRPAPTGFARLHGRVNRNVRLLEMHSAETMVKMLFNAFPQRVVRGIVAPHDCEECSALRDQLTGVTWQDVPGDFVHANDGALPLLSHEAYVAFLPAWLRQAVLDPSGPAAGMVLINLHHKLDTIGFTRRQAKVIMEVARYVVHSGIWGPEDPGNVESLAEIERVWSSVAA